MKIIRIIQKCVSIKSEVGYHLNKTSDSSGRGMDKKNLDSEGRNYNCYMFCIWQKNYK